MEIVIPVIYLAAAATTLGGVLLAGLVFYYWRLFRKLSYSLDCAIKERDNHKKLCELLRNELNCKERKYKTTPPQPSTPPTDIHLVKEEADQTLWDASKCSCSHPPYRPPCGYCENGNYSASG